MSEPGPSSQRGGRGRGAAGAHAPPAQSTPQGARSARSSRASPRAPRGSQGGASAAASPAVASASGAAAARSSPDVSRYASQSGAPSASKEARENAERAHLNAVLGELNAQIDALRAQIDAARAQNDALAAQKAKEAEQSRIDGVQPSEELVLDDEIEALLKGMDDDALTALLSSSSSALMSKLIGGGDGAKAAVSLAAESGHATAEAQAFVSVPAPALSAGIEGRGAGKDIDSRLAAGSALASDAATRAPAAKRRRTDTELTQDSPTNDPHVDKDADSADAQDKHAWMEEWLTARRERGEELLENLQSFTRFEIETLEQKRSVSADRLTTTRTFEVRGWMRCIGTVRVQMTVQDERGHGPPTVADLRIDLPPAVKSALRQESHLDSLISRCDAPAVFNTLRGLVAAAQARRKLFEAVSSQLRVLCKGKARALNAAELLLAPSATNSNRQQQSQQRARRKSQAHSLAAELGLPDDAQVADEDIALAVFEPELADTLVLGNDKDAQMHLRYRIAFDAFGRSIADVTLTAQLPDAVANEQEARDVLDAMPTQFRQMVQHKPGLEGVSEARALESIVLSVAACFFGASP